ncbi:MAG: helix-turn-helix transcriptional regulator [Treponema sp.]|nr:helix-turn-helix transcriptional regulator [Treponema sp.]
MTPSQTSDQNNTEPKKKVPYHFGEKLRMMREHKGYTLKYVAQQAGVSESLVSQIERNHVSPAIDTLLSLAEVLDINLEFLFDEYRRQHPVQIIRADERAKMNEDDVHYEELAQPDPNEKSHDFEAYIVKIPAHTHTHRGSYGHIGREVGIITKGKAALHYENQVYQMSEGDSVSFPASAPHTLENAGDTELEAIWIVSPAQRFVRE